MAVHAATQRNLGIVNVKNRYFVEADGVFDLCDGRSQTRLGLNVVARRKKMRSVQARGHRKILQTGENLCHLFQSTTHGGTHASGIFNQNCKVAEGVSSAS